MGEEVAMAGVVCTKRKVLGLEEDSLVFSSKMRVNTVAMGISKTEVNLRRLLAAAPQQQNQAKLVHIFGFCSMLREQLEQLAEERTLEGLPRISKAMLNDYSEKIEAIASKLVNHVVLFYCCSSDSLDRPASSTEDKAHELAETDHTSPIKLDATAHAHVEKHRKLQEDLTDDMVVLAKQLKESSLTMSQSLQNTEKDSSRISYFHSILLHRSCQRASNGNYSDSSKTSCLTWLVMFVMTYVFVMVILLICVTV
ncbi:hypothetical protein D0Y65_005335 [Glycine soja]|uniref:Uncharacterized protein n=1 Tax=Glycine soja TaxID=3848 RepID=A0A445LV99_GLYSO|nr:hypothetical protein D0Y65_005335 [Glycine soja]